MASFSLLILAFCSAITVSASPRNLIARGKERNANPDGYDVPPGYSNGRSWGPASNDWGCASQYDGSWDHSSTADHPSSQYGGGGGWGHGTTCAALTVTEISTSQVAGPTVYISGAGYTTTLSASTVYVSGSEHTSYIPASTVTVAAQCRLQSRLSMALSYSQQRLRLFTSHKTGLDGIEPSLTKRRR